MVCLVLDKDFGLTRDDLMKKLKDNGIDTRPFFYPMSEMPIYRSSGTNKGLNLPSGVNLTKEEVEWICEEIKTILKNI